MINLGEFSGKRICAAVSGGADSMSLLHMLKEKSGECGFSLCAVNCEHGIRGKSSLADSRFVEEICRDWKIPLYSFAADCPAEAEEKKISLETAAREFRYRCFERLMNEGKTDFVATAHHLGDEAETVLFRLCRGASLSGAGGIGERRGRYLRPLLGMTKAEILEYAAANSIPFREDESNLDTRFTRNRLRIGILPALEKAVPGAARTLARFARIAAEDDEFLYGLSEALIEKSEPETEGDTGYRLLFSPNPPLFRRACLTILKALGVEKDYTFFHLERVYALQREQTGNRIDLPGGIEAKRVYEKIVFYYSGKVAPPFENGERQLAAGTWEMGRYEITVTEGAGNPKVASSETFGKVLLLDKDKLPKDAAFRFKRAGDSFEKFGGGRKPLKKYLIDKKIPQAVRAELPVLAAKSEIYAVCGVEIADGVKITESTRRALCITIRKKQEKDQ